MINQCEENKNAVVEAPYLRFSAGVEDVHCF